MSIGTGIAICGISAVPVAAMLSKSVTGQGLSMALIFAVIAIAAVTCSSQ